MTLEQPPVDTVEEDENTDGTGRIELEFEDPVAKEVQGESPEAAPEALPETSESAEDQIEINPEAEKVESAKEAMESLVAEHPQIATLARMSGDFENIDKYEKAPGRLRDIPEELHAGKLSVEYDLNRDSIKLNTTLIGALESEIDRLRMNMGQASAVLMDQPKRTFFGRIFGKKRSYVASNAESRKENAQADINDIRTRISAAEKALSDWQSVINISIPKSFAGQIDSSMDYDAFLARLEVEIQNMSQLKDQYPDPAPLVARYKELSQEIASDTAEIAKIGK